MTAQQRADHRDLYNQLRLNLAFPGETVAEVVKPYVDKWALSYDELLLTPDTPRVAYLRGRYGVGTLATVGMRGAA